MVGLAVDEISWLLGWQMLVRDLSGSCWGAATCADCRVPGFSALFCGSELEYISRKDEFELL